MIDLNNEISFKDGELDVLEVSVKKEYDGFIIHISALEQDHDQWGYAGLTVGEWNQLKEFVDSKLGD